MPEEAESVGERNRLRGRMGPLLMLGASLLTIVVVFLPWAHIEVTDPNVDVRNGWYSGLQLVLPLLLVALMIVPLVASVLALAGRGTGSRSLEVGLCSFMFGMEFLMLCLLLVMNTALQDLADKVDLFDFGLGAGYWAAIVLLALNILGLILTARRVKRNAEPAAEAGR